MLNRNKLFGRLLQDLNDMGLPGISATLDKMYRSPKFLELDPLMTIANLVDGISIIVDGGCAVGF